MVLFKALVIGTLVTLIFAIIVTAIIWLLPLLGLLAVFLTAVVIAYAVIDDWNKEKPP